MTTTTRIRLFLVLAAILPPILILSALHLITNQRQEQSARRSADESLNSYAQFDMAYHERMHDLNAELIKMEAVKDAALRIESHAKGQITLGSLPPGIDFMEILSKDLKVIVSAHRPGLVGEKMPLDTITLDSEGYLARTEYDIGGPHAAYSYLSKIDDHLYLYSGTYIDRSYLDLLAEITNANIDLVMADDSSSESSYLSRLDANQLYERGSSLIAVLSGGKQAGFYITATFSTKTDSPIFQSLFEVTALAALVSVILAIFLGMYITGKTKKEIDNLITASRQVAEGDWTTPVMAYEEGEFSELADSFNSMKRNLKTTQDRLTTAEKIAAWEAMGRKVAHEIKNPLTPISIGIDDLKAAYSETPENFNQTLDQTVRTIKYEVNRMKRLLDQFSAFARMAPPNIKETAVTSMIEKITTLYKSQIESATLSIDINALPKSIKCDEEQIEQLLINLIKNALESGESTKVEIVCGGTDKDITFTIRDNGPGFDDKVLSNPFEPYVSTKKDGSGLGLVICRRIVHDHGGRIELRNRREGGAEVLIALPR